MITSASLGSHQRFKVEAVIDNVKEVRSSLIDAVFPYMNKTPEKPKESEYDALFDELEEMHRKAEAEKADEEKKKAEEEKEAEAENRQDKEEKPANMV